MRVVTQNLLGHHTDRPRRLPAAAGWFRRLDPAVVAPRGTVVADGCDQATEVLGDGYPLTHHPLREVDGSGISITSRLPTGGA